MARKKVEPIENLLAAHQKQRGPAPAKADNILDELRGAAEIIAIKPLKYAGKVYGIGDKITLDGGRWDEQLMEQKYFTTKLRWEAGQRHYAQRKFYINELQPLQARYERAKRDTREATEAETAAAAALVTARERLEIAQGREQAAEDELRALLTGEIE